MPIIIGSRGARAMGWTPGSGTGPGGSSGCSRRWEWRAPFECPRSSRFARPTRWGRRSMQPPPPRAVPTPPGSDDFVAELGVTPRDARDPDPWWTLYSDRALPLDPQTKAALVLDS